MEPINRANNDDDHDSYDVYNDLELMQTALVEIRRCNALRYARESQTLGVVPFNSSCIHMIHVDWDSAMQPPL